MNKQAEPMCLMSGLIILMLPVGLPIPAWLFHVSPDLPLNQLEVTVTDASQE
jgi:hypothetical protein